MFKEVPKNCRYAYGRVFSKSQEDNSSLEPQKQEFIQQGMPEKNIRIEIGSTTESIKKRPVFYNLIENQLKEGDCLIIIKIDRCSRNTLSFLQLKSQLSEKHVHFQVLELPKKYVNRVNYQKNFWSDETAVKGKIPHINPDADLPKSPDNVLGLYDFWDVGTPEKSTVSNAITALSGNDTNLIFLNNITNT